MRIKDLVPNVRRIIRDARGKYWSDEEVEDYLIDGQEEYVRLTGSLRSEFPITTKENQTVYNLPEDCMEVFRLTNTEGTVLTPTTSGELDRTKGSGWQDSTGTPRSFYSDLDGEGKFRFYPRPKPSIETGASAIGDRGIHRFNFPSVTGVIKSIQKANDKIYVLVSDLFAHSSEIFVYAADMIFIKKLSIAKYVASFTIVNKDATVMNSDIVGDIFFLDGSDRKTVYHLNEHSGSYASHTVLAGSVEYSIMTNCDFTDSSSFIVYRSSSNVAYIVNTDASTSASLAVGAGVIYDCCASLDFFMSSGGDGLVKIANDGTQTTIDGTNRHAFLQTPYDIFGPAQKIIVTNWFTNEFEIYNDLDGTYTPTGVPYSSNGYSYCLRYDIDHDVLYAFTSRTNLVRYDSFVATCNITFPATTYTGYYETAMTSNFDILMAVKTSGTTIWLAYTDPDLGLISILNGADTNLNGAIVDYGDTDEPNIQFSQEEGAVVQVYQETDIAKSWYVRFPSDTQVEISDTMALIEYACYRAYEKDENRQNLSRAAYFNALFMNRVARVKARVIRGFNRSRVTNRGYYY